MSDGFQKLRKVLTDWRRSLDTGLLGNNDISFYMSINVGQISHRRRKYLKRQNVIIAASIREVLRRIATTKENIVNNKKSYSWIFFRYITRAEGLENWIHTGHNKSKRIRGNLLENLSKQVADQIPQNLLCGKRIDICYAKWLNMASSIVYESSRTGVVLIMIYASTVLLNSFY